MQQPAQSLFIFMEHAHAWTMSWLHTHQRDAKASEELILVSGIQ